MSDIATNVCCRRCNQRLAVERGGVLFVGFEAFECVVNLLCRVCAHTTKWLPLRARPTPAVTAEQPEVRVNRTVKGLWDKAVA